MSKTKIDNTSSRPLFTTRLGVIATTVGSAVGLGNIWRFPYEAGAHGGGAFMILYIAFIVILGIPLITAEYTLGRATHSGFFGVFRMFKAHRAWNVLGYMGVLSAILILSFYSVVAGWTLEYFFGAVGGAYTDVSREGLHAVFGEFTSGLRPLMWTSLFLLINYLIISRGVASGIERISNVLMPLLLALIVVFCINSLMLPEAGAGLRFLFKPDFGSITGPVVIGAMGQAFFSLSLGLGCMMTYGSYFNDRNRLGRTAATTAILDSMVAILAGVIIFPAVFSFDLSPEAGPTLVFEVLPYIFNQLPGGMIWSTLFFLLLFLASLTSTVSMSEISITYFCEEKHMTRRNATILSSVIALVGGVLCAMSFGPLSDFTIFGMTIFSLFDYLSSNVCLPIGGFICSLFVGWWVNKKFLRDQLTDFGKFRFPLYRPLLLCLRWLCPAAIFLIFLNSIGLL